MCRFLSPSTDRMRLMFSDTVIISSICNSNIAEIYKKILSWLTSRGIDLFQVIWGGGGFWVKPQPIIKEKNKIFGPLYDHIGNFVLMSSCLAPWASLVSLRITHPASVDCQALLYNQSWFSNLPTRLLHPWCWCNWKLYNLGYFKK